jgi:hypothetical protein
MDNPITDRTFFYISDNGICEPCKENLDAQIKSQVRNKDPFSYEWYEKFVQDSLAKAVQKGKI